MPDFDKNAGYIWAIVIVGLIVPALLTGYAVLRLHLAKTRLNRLKADENDA